MMKDGTILAMTATKDDKYAPKKTGVFDIVAEPLIRTWNAQKWKYDGEKQAFTNYFYHPAAVVSEGKNGNLFLYNNLNLNIQKFIFDAKSGYLRNIHSNKVATVGKLIKSRIWEANIEDQKTPEIIEQFWHAVECNYIPQNKAQLEKQENKEMLDFVQEDNTRQEKENKFQLQGFYKLKEEENFKKEI